jgi:hypothetical protein
MRFIGQVELLPEVFGNIDGRMAYLFMTDCSEEVEWEQSEPDEGENAVIIQPGDLLVPVQNLAEGPTVMAYSDEDEDCEFSTHLTLGEDPECEDDAWEDDEYCSTMPLEKVGGLPDFIQNSEFPNDEFPTLLLQLTDAVPFYVDFGDCGTGFAFLSRDGRSAKFFWQCS